ncbi:MAG: leucine-rich repeat domain-containing protein, partial [Anaerolineales bacterium]|nr:leucine-rich repeat domain-containing protein [Anaerolineales bacterium]
TVEHDDIPSDIVTFKDANLEKAIRDALEIPTELLKKEDLAKLKELKYDGSKLAKNKRIADLTGIEYCTSLRLLHLYGNQIRDISALANLTSLTYTALPLNEISDIAALANLTSLTGLHLEDNQISDISVLGNLTNLKSLTLHHNQISDILVLENLTNLTRLSAGNQISDISVLENLTNLQGLTLHYNQISNISTLANLTSLTQLYLYNNQISDISVLSSLTKLTELRLEDNKIGDITPLVENTGISGTIELKGNPLSNTALSTHIPALKERGITVEHDEMPSDIIKMSNASFEVSLRKSIDIPDDILTPANTSPLVDLDLTNAGIVDLDMEALKSLPSLKSVNLTNNPLSSNAVVVQIPELESAGITVDLGTSVAAKVELSAEKLSIPASLASTTDITVTVTDASGRAVKRETVNLSVDQGTIQTPATNNGDGTYTATYAATDVAGEVQITAITSNGKFGLATIKLTETLVSAGKSALEISGNTTPETGEQVSVAITLLSEEGLPLSGQQVELKVSPEEKVAITPDTTKTDKEGKIVVTFTSGKAGVKIVKAVSGGVELASSAAVIFTGDEIAVAETVTAVAT